MGEIANVRPMAFADASKRNGVNIRRIVAISSKRSRPRETEAVRQNERIQRGIYTWEPFLINLLTASDSLWG